MMHWFVNRPHDNGCVYYRQTLPIRHLARSLSERGVRITYARELKLSRDYDAYFFNRWIEPAWLPVILDLKRRGKLIVWDMDDDLLRIDRIKADYRDQAMPRIWALQVCLDMADVITVSTPQLAEALGHPEKSVVLPNLIDLADNPIEPENSDSDVILFTGSKSHIDDLELVRDLYRQTCQRFRWVFYGVEPRYLDRHATYIPWSRVADYPRVCRLLRPRVCLAPLTVDPFNESKSPIKVWECATLGASLLASDTGPYRGHPAAIVAEGEPFTIEDLAAVLARPNYEECLEVAKDNSWQSSPATIDWWCAFRDFASFCQDRLKEAA